MNEDVKFESKDDLKDWLKSRRVDEDDVDAAAKLFTNGFNKPSKLLGISIQELKDHAGIVGPVAPRAVNVPAGS